MKILPCGRAVHADGVCLFAYLDATSCESCFGGQTGPDDTPDRPAKGDQKADWVAYAVAQGEDPQEAEESTKDDLITRHTPQETES